MRNLFFFWSTSWLSISFVVFLVAIIVIYSWLRARQGVMASEFSYFTVYERDFSALPSFLCTLVDIAESVRITHCH